MKSPTLTTLLFAATLSASCTLPTGPDTSDSGDDDNTQQNTSPVIESFAYSPLNPEVGQEIILEATYHDEESPLEELTLGYDTDEDGFFDDASTVTYTTSGEKTVKVQVKDPEGLSTLESLTFTVSESLDADTTPPETSPVTLETSIDPGKINYSFYWPTDDDSTTGEEVSGIDDVVLYASALGNLTTSELTTYATQIAQHTAQPENTLETSEVILDTPNADYAIYAVFSDAAENSAMVTGTVRTGGPVAPSYVVWGTVTGFGESDEVEIYNVKDTLPHELLYTVSTDASGTYGTEVNHLPDDTQLIITPKGMADTAETTYQAGGGTSEHNF